MCWWRGWKSYYSVKQIAKSVFYNLLMLSCHSCGSRNPYGLPLKFIPLCGAGVTIEGYEVGSKYKSQYVREILKDVTGIGRLPAQGAGF